MCTSRLQDAKGVLGFQRRMHHSLRMKPKDVRATAFSTVVCIRCNERLSSFIWKRTGRKTRIYLLLDWFVAVAMLLYASQDLLWPSLTDSQFVNPALRPWLSLWLSDWTKGLRLLKPWLKACHGSDIATSAAQSVPPSTMWAFKLMQPCMSQQFRESIRDNQGYIP